jgi:fucose permease
MSVNKNNIKVPLMLSFLIFSMLLNSMGVIILKLSEHISYSGLGFLESFKDLPMAIVSLLCVNFINKTGNKNALMFSLVFIIISCIALPLVDAFWFFKLWLSIVGVSFALAKISVYTIIKDNFKDRQLASTMSRVEASFMIGIFIINIGFGSLLSGPFADYWKFGFWPIAVLSGLTLLILRPLKLNETPILDKHIFAGGIGFMLSKKMLCFFAIIFLMVFVEQSFNSWLPTFLKSNLRLSSYFALQSSAFLALFSFIGRIVTSRLILRFHWFRFVIVCLLGIFFILLSSQLLISYVANSRLLLAVLIPVTGLFLSPLYPLYNSEALNKIPSEKTHLFISVVVIFSSIGSSVGSVYMALIFHNQVSSYYPLFISLPLIVIFGLTFCLNQKTLAYDRKQ